MIFIRAQNPTRANEAHDQASCRFHSLGLRRISGLRTVQTCSSIFTMRRDFADDQIVNSRSSVLRFMLTILRGTVIPPAV